MKTTAARATDFVAWLKASTREAHEITLKVGEELRAHLKQELVALCTILEAKHEEAKDDRDRIALSRARELLAEFVDPRSLDGEPGAYVQLDCATCARLGKLMAPMECVGANATDLPWKEEPDANARLHHHDPNRRAMVFRCASGHQLVAFGRVACWCGWKAEGPAT